MLGDEDGQSPLEEIFIWHLEHYCTWNIICKTLLYKENLLKPKCGAKLL